MPVIEIDEECKACGGTGLYMGLSEYDGFAVVCAKCKGTGCYHYHYEYKDFSRRKMRDDVKHVIQHNPGIVVGIGKYQFSDFGGMSYGDWLDGREFISGTEMRKFACPCWWYEADADKKPRWEECWHHLGYPVRNCAHFPKKEKCWKRWDKEFGDIL
ncbi:MAG: hypothetical protein PHO27_12025 [Sulfuricurvum sp.]|jgi:hypothetical protein|nr:hypothetical protein [Sulfuricurvum sp.]